jgi:putative tricarboxylic transport membrane protein
MSDRIFSVVWLACCAAIAWLAWQIEAPFSYEPIGPRAFPLLLAAAMALASVWLLAKPSREPDWPRGELRGKVVLLIGAFVGYSLLFEPLGFPVATALATLVIGRTFGGGWTGSLAAGAALGGGLWFFFDKLLDVTLPLGRLWAGA